MRARDELESTLRDLGDPVLFLEEWEIAETTRLVTDSLRRARAAGWQGLDGLRAAAVALANRSADREHAPSVDGPRVRQCTVGALTKVCELSSSPDSELRALADWALQGAGLSVRGLGMESTLRASEPALLRRELERSLRLLRDGARRVWRTLPLPAGGFGPGPRRSPASS